MQLSDIHKARDLIQPYIQKTPLVHAKILDRPGVRLFLKCEHLQVSNSFKARGAFNALLNLNNEDKKRGVITRSAGNFAKKLSA